MAEEFNPYHVWLGIPPEEQPANHYRLLGIKPFETSGDVIDSAADRQMAHLRTFQSGKHGELTQRLLNEVAAVRICLLDPKKRAAYDQQLRAKLAAASAATASGAEMPAAGGSAIQRQPPRRTTGPVPASPVANIPTAAPLPQQSADPWDNLLGQPDVKSTSGSGGKSAKTAAAKSAAAKRGANNRNMMIGIGVAVALVAVAGIGLLLLNGSSSDGTLVFDWPAAYRTDTNVSIDGVPLAIPASGPWEYRYPAGSHRIIADHLAYKLDAHIDLATGSQQPVPADWKPKAILVLNWPPALRVGAELKIDGRVQTISQHDPLEVPVEPGRRTIVITRRGYDPIHTTATVAADGRELVSIAAPPTTAKLVFDWPAAERKDAELIVDGQSQTVAADSDSAPFELTLPSGQHIVHITRTGFEPFNQSVDLSAGTDNTIKPTWTPERKIVAAPAVADTPVPIETTAPQPAKKLPIPAAAEQEKIAKQLNDVYKTSQPGPKDPAKAQELYDVAAKDGSSPNERYMLLMKGAEIAAVAGDLNLSLSGIDTLDADYDIDAFEAKQKLLEKFITAGKPDQVATAIPTAEQLVDQAVAADRYDIAVVLATSASKAVTKSKIATHKEDEERLSRRRHDIHLLEPIYAAAKKAEETLEKTPPDPEANLTVGRWLCFYKEDWTTGLPMLAKGSDEKLKSLAEQETKSPTDAEEQVQIADAWWDLAQKEAGIARDSLRLHAGEIYQTALPNLASALRKAAIEKRLAEIAGVSPVAPAPISGSGGITAKIPVGKWVDVLRFVDPARNTLAGTFERRRDGLVAPRTDGNSLVELPVAINGDFDLEVDFTRTQGTSDVHVVFPIGSHQCNCVLSAFNGDFSELYQYNHQGSNSPVFVRPGAITNGQRHRLLIHVASKSEHSASIDVSLDDKLYLPHWEGDPNVWWTGDWRASMPSRITIGQLNGEVIFHSIRLRMTSGHASFDRAIAKSIAPQPAPAAVVSGKPTGAVKFPLGRWIDALRLLNLNEGIIRGTWARMGTEIYSGHSPVNGMELPITIDGGYDIDVDFTRAQGENDIHLVFPVGAHECDAILSAYAGKLSGLYEFDGHGVEDSPINSQPGTIENNRRHRLSISVRLEKEDSATIKAFLDGKPAWPDWQGNPEHWSVGHSWAPSSMGRLAIGQRDGQVTFHSFRLKMVSGHAEADSPFTPEPGLPTIISARWGSQNSWEDVTLKVRKSVLHGAVVRANVDFFDSDPIDGTPKQLEITYEKRGKKGAVSINEGERWSKDDYENLKP